MLAGEVYCSPRVTYSMFHRLGEMARERRRHEEAQSLDLTPREMEVLRLISDGLTNRQIAERVCLSVYTVKNHVHNILAKLEVERREMAVEEAYARELAPAAAPLGRSMSPRRMDGAAARRRGRGAHPTAAARRAALARRGDA